MAESKRRCHMAETAKDLHGLPDNWVWCKADSDQPEDYIRLTGAVYEPMKGGKRKGKPNWKKPHQGTERSVFIRRRDVTEWEARQEAETGDCMTCDGTGQKVVGWSRDKGIRYADCARCGATGRAPKREGE